MDGNKFFNDSSNTSTGKPKFMPPQKRHMVEGTNEPTLQEPTSNFTNQNTNTFQNRNQQQYPQYQSQRANFTPSQNYSQQPNYNQPSNTFYQPQGNYGQYQNSYNQYNNYNQPQPTYNQQYPSNYGQQYGNYNQSQTYNQGQNFYNRGHQSHLAHHHAHHHHSHSVDPKDAQHGQIFPVEDNQNEKRFNSKFFDKNRSRCLSNWGYRHLRTGHVDKDVEAEEKALFEVVNNSNPLQIENVKNYDHLKVEVTNRFKLPMPQPKENFVDLELHKALLDNINRCGYQKLTIIQKNAIPIMTNRINLMASSQTGSGKTASFLLPIIQDLLNSGPPQNDVSKEEYKKSRKCYPLALILAPTRELAIQIHEEARKFCHLTGILAKVIYGGKEAYNQQRYLSWDGCDILVTTPGRLIDFMDRIVDFNYIRTVVLDEADRMLDMGFEPQIRQIMDRSYANGGNILVAMFSATFPKEVRGLAEKYLQQYIYVGIGSEGGKTGSVSKTIKQEIVDVRHKVKNPALFDYLKNLEGKVLIFCATKKAVAELYSYLSAKNLFVAHIHGDLSQRDREAELALFKNKCSILIATDVASRGLDIPDVAYVINYDLPTNIESYIHRIGRTGRIGKTGTAISFLTDFDEPMFNKLYNVLRDTNQEIPGWFHDLIRTKYQKEERYPGQGKGKPYNQKYRGGYGGNRNFYGGNRGFQRTGGFDRGFEDKGYDSDYSKHQTYAGGNKDFDEDYDDNYGYE